MKKIGNFREKMGKYLNVRILQFLTPTKELSDKQLFTSKKIPLSFRPSIKNNRKKQTNNDFATQMVDFTAWSYRVRKAD
jgi:hypothetical protein